MVGLAGVSVPLALGDGVAGPAGLAALGTIGETEDTLLEDGCLAFVTFKVDVPAPKASMASEIPTVQSRKAVKTRGLKRPD